MYSYNIETINVRIELPVEIVDFLRETNVNVPVPQLCAAIICDTVAGIVNRQPEPEKN